MESVADKLRHHAAYFEEEVSETVSVREKSFICRKTVGSDLREAAARIDNLSQEVSELRARLEESGWQLAEYRDQNERMEEIASSTVDTAEEIYNAREQIKQAHKQLEIQKEELRLLAITDPLTGAYNRRYLMSFIEEQSAVRNENLSLLMMDIDHFKSVNDTFGHHAGDIALKAFTDLCMARLPEDAILGRLGGEEFAMALPGIALQQATDIAEGIRQETSELTCREGPDNFGITVSVGVSCIKNAKKVGVDLISHADTALYKAKETGRNQVTVAAY